MRFRTLVLLLGLAPLADGCLVTGALDANGGGRLTVHTRLVSVRHFEDIKRGLTSPYVTLKDASMTSKKRATFELECSDVKRLSTAPAMRHLIVGLLDAGNGVRSLAVTLSNPTPQPWSEALQRYFGDELAVSIDLPGDVIRTNATAKTGRTVSWTWSLAELPAQERTDLSATYELKDGS